MTHILIAEDEEILRTTFQDILEEAGFRVDAAKNGEEALEIMRKDPPDVLFTDIRMPRKNGFELLEAKNEIERLKEIPSVILTNLESEEDIERGLGLGAKEYIVKANMEVEDIVEIANRYSELTSEQT